MVSFHCVRYSFFIQQHYGYSCKSTESHHFAQVAFIDTFFFFFYPYQSEGSRCFHVRIVKYHETLLTRQIIKYRRTISKIIKNYCTISTSFFPRSIPLSLQCSYSVMNVLHSTVKLLTIVLIQIASHPTKS